MSRHDARLEAAQAEGQRQADEFNRRYPVGTPVVAYPLTRPEDNNPHFFKQLETVTRTPAWILGHGDPVVSVEGYAGGICLTHVDIAPRTNTPVEDSHEAKVAMYLSTPYTDDFPSQREAGAL